MKKSRHDIILELITENEVETQEELMKLLHEKKIDVTQATISRDIREMKLVKQIGKNGICRYVQAQSTQERFMKYNSMFASSLKSVDSAQNIVVIKCQTGTANGVCVALDSMELKDVLGTIAGDDTIFMLCKNDKTARDTKSEILTLM